MKALMLALALGLGACAMLSSQDKAAVEAHAHALVACQEEGRAASAACKASDGGACDKAAIDTYNGCKKDGGL